MSLDLLTKDFEKKRSLKKASVKLSTGDVFECWFNPIQNVEQQSRILKHVDFQTGQVDTGIFLTSLIVRALNEDGTRMFKDFDEKVLRVKVDHEVLQDLFNQMGGGIEAVDPKKS